MIDFAQARQMMVDSQVRPNGVTDLRIVSMFLKVAREDFVPAQHAALAYLDRDIALIEGKDCVERVLTKPMVLAKLIQAADFRADERVLVVGCATGYAAALIAPLVARVIALEEDQGLSAMAKKALAATPNVDLVLGPLAEGWPMDAPYDAILVDGGLERLPDMLFHQLKDPGRIVAVAMRGPIGKGTVWHAAAGHVSAAASFDACEPVLPGFRRSAEFVF